MIRETPDFASSFHARSESLLSDPSYDCPNAWEYFSGPPVEELDEPRWSRSGRHLHLFPGGVVGNITALYRKEGVLQEFLSDMRFREELEVVAQSALRKIKEQHLNKKRNSKKTKKNKSKMVFVGIHCRRTDHIAYERRFGKV